MKISKKIISGILSITMILTTLPIASVSTSVSAADANGRLTKEEDPDYNPNYTLDMEPWDAIVAKSSDIQDIGRLPTLDEFRAQTGYVSSEIMTLTKFRETYGIGESFIVPTDSTVIYIKTFSELQLLSNLVNNVADGETIAEQGYYSTASYKLFCDITCSGTTWKPIGCSEYHFNGTFDGNKCEISKMNMTSADATTYPDTYDFGLFGVIGENGIVKNLGVISSTMVINYSVASTAGFIAGRNYGTIQDCYVNSKISSHITISNATAAGICGENYGLIKGCYADAYINMQSEETTFSEPQPITTVNHTEVDASVVDCYYLNWFNTAVIQSQIVSKANDAGNNALAVGWKYNGDMSQVNGTGLDLLDFIDASGMTGTIFKPGAINATEENNYYSTYGRSMRDCVKLFGTGEKFNKWGTANAKGYGLLPVVYGRADWTLLCKLVNKEMPNETDEEQQFWAKSTIYIYAAEEILDTGFRRFKIYADDLSLGTTEYPFTGKIRGNKTCIWKLTDEYAPDGDHIARPVFGDMNGTVEQLALCASGNDISAFIGKSLFCENNRGRFTETYFMGNNTYFTGSTDYGINIYSNHTDYADFCDTSLVGAKVCYFQNNYGTIDTVYNAMSYSIYAGTDNTSSQIGRYMLRLVRNVQTGSNISYVTDYVSYGESNGVSTSGRMGSNYAEYKAWQSNVSGIAYSTMYSCTRTNDVLTSDFQWYDISYPPPKNYRITIGIYPSISVPETDENGVYLIYEPNELFWLLKYGQGKDITKAKLMKSIDMTNYQFNGGTVYSGDFSIDGTLTDNSDICAGINLGDDITKCYGIINLQLINRPLAVRNKINWSNVYFIGGYFKNTRSFGWDWNANIHSAQALGNKFDHVHSSFDMDVQDMGYNPEDGRYFAQVGYATNSSFSGTFYDRATGHYRNTQSIYGCAQNSVDCVFYTEVFVDSSVGSTTGYDNIKAIGVNVTHSIIRTVPSKKSGHYTGSTWHGICATNMVNCLFDATYDFEGAIVPKRFFANILTNCTISGTVKNGHRHMHDPIGLFNDVNGLVMTSESKVEGNFNYNAIGLYPSINNVLIQSQVDFWISARNNYLCEGNNLIFAGKFNIHAAEEIDCRNIDSDSQVGDANWRNAYKELGITKAFSYNSWGEGVVGLIGGTSNVVNIGEINFVDFDRTDGVYHINSRIQLFRGKGVTNYSDIHFTGKTGIQNVSIFEEAIGDNKCINYGNITQDETVVFRSFGLFYNTVQNGIWHDIKNMKNFGDITLHNVTYDIRLFFKNTNSSSEPESYNYGTFTYERASKVGIPAYIYLMAAANVGTRGVFSPWGTFTRAYNYGDAYIDLKKDTIPIVNTQSIEAITMAYGGNNWGNLTLRNIPNINAQIVGSSMHNYGNFDFENISGSNMWIRGLWLGDYAHNGTFNSKGNIRLKDITLSNYFECAPVYDYDSNAGTWGAPNFNIDTDIEIDNLKVTRTNYNCAYIIGISTSQYGSNFDNDIGTVRSNCDWNISNVTLGSGSNLIISGAYNYQRPKYKAPVYTSGNITVNNINCSQLLLGGVMNYLNYADHSEFINDLDINVNNLSCNGESRIAGVATTTSTGVSIANCYNFGDIIIDTGTDSTTTGSLLVAGVSDYGCMKPVDGRPSTIINFGNIDVKTNKNSYIAGVCAARAEDKNEYNGINCGDINVHAYGNNLIGITGVTRNAVDGRGLVNYGNITQTGVASSNSYVLAISNNRTNGKITSCINYGNINVDPSFAGEIGLTNNDDNTNIDVGYIINYGNFSRGNVISTFNSTKYIIDLSNNKDILPNGNTIFSNDSNISGTTSTVGRSYNNLEYAVKEILEMPDESTENRCITYDNFIAPEFGLRYNNLLSTEYITAVNKKWENVDNGFEYADRDELTGTLADLVDRYSGTGGYALTMYNLDGSNKLGVDIEEGLYINNEASEENVPAWWSNYTVDGMSVQDFVETKLRQRTIDTVAEYYDINIESVEEHETKAGGNNKVSNKSTLTTFQAPINDSEVLTFTIADLYTTVNVYRDIINKDIDWNVSVTGTRNMNFRLFDEPIACTDADDMVAKINALSTVPENSVSIVNMQLANTGGTNYYIIGVATAEDGKHKNVIGVKLHSITTDPLGWATRFSYPKQYGKKYDNELQLSENFTADAYYYNLTNRFDVYTGDLYTVTQGTPENTEYANNKYPIYQMTENMIHTADGYFYHKWSGPLENYIESIPNIVLHFRTQNIDTYRIEIESNLNTFKYTGTCPVDGVATKDGSQTIKYNIVSFKDVEFKDDDNNVMTMNYNSTLNPFYAPGDKTITVYGWTDATDEIPILQIKLSKNLSFENYLKNNLDGYRSNYFDRNGVTAQTWLEGISLEHLSRSKFWADNTAISTEATKVNDRYIIGPLVQHGDSIYPTGVKSLITIRAQDGSEQEYTHEYLFPDFDICDYSVGNNASATISNQSGVWTMTDECTWFNISTDLNSNKVQTVAHKYVKLPSGDNQTLRWNLEKVEVYLDGEFQGYASINNPENQSSDAQSYYAPYKCGVNIYVHLGRLDFTWSGNKAELPDGVITMRPYLSYTMTNGEKMIIRIKDFDFQKALSEKHTLIQANINNPLVAQFVTDDADGESENLEAGVNGVINYHVEDPDTVSPIYVYDTVEIIKTNSTATYTISPYSVLQLYDGTNWNTVFTAGGSSENVYTVNYTYDLSTSGQVEYQYRILAQGYLESDPEKSLLVTYFNHNIAAAKRNKTLEIKFKDTDATTMELYDEIIADRGNLTVQVKNMNIGDLRWQQTKFYTSDSSSLDSNYYNLSQGDYAVLIDLPDGYDATVRFVGTSSEGYLRKSPNTKGQRFKLPFPHAQNIRLEITLQRKATNKEWGTIREKSTYKTIYNNQV